MSAITFPTGKRAVNGRLGFPLRASACRCEWPLVDLATDCCVRCGHYPADVIDETWSEQARVISLPQRTAFSRRLRLTAT